VRLDQLAVDEVLDGVASRYSRRAEAAGRELSQSGETSLVVPGDRVRLEQAMSNLLDNALRHGEGSVELAALACNGSVELHVRDRGPGFPDDFRERAFERFSRANPSQRQDGSGLGLAIVEAIARAHGGHARVENREGGGADAWLSLPVPRN
jgi:two-component system, OmpR family, sensor kinase